MPKNQRPSYLKRQKEQQRKAKAEQKREARRARREQSAVDDQPETDIETPTEPEEPVEQSRDEPGPPPSNRYADLLNSNDLPRAPLRSRPSSGPARDHRDHGVGPRRFRRVGPRAVVVRAPPADTRHAPRRA